MAKITWVVLPHPSQGSQHNAAIIRKIIQNCETKENRDHNSFENLGFQGTSSGTLFSNLGFQRTGSGTLFKI
jgi:hypothetical protein